MREFQSNRLHDRSTQRYNNPPPSQIIKRGQAGEGAAGDAGDGIGRESSAMEWFRDQSVSECRRDRLHFMKNRRADGRNLRSPRKKKRHH